MSTFVFNFNLRFAGVIRRGEKRQTIRQTRKDKRVPAVGDLVKLYTGLRTKDTLLLGEGFVTTCQPIVVDWWTTNAWGIYPDGRRLVLEEANDFAQADGFKSAQELLDWFKDTYPAQVKLEGFCVRWLLKP